MKSLGPSLLTSDEEMEPVIIPDNPGRSLQAIYPCAGRPSKSLLPYMQHARPAELVNGAIGAYGRR